MFLLMCTIKRVFFFFFCHGGKNEWGILPFVWTMKGIFTFPLENGKGLYNTFSFDNSQGSCATLRGIWDIAVPVFRSWWMKELSREWKYSAV